MEKNYETDSHDYHILQDAAKLILGIPGAVCEIGTRKGGSALMVVDALLENGDRNRNMICLDPYGNLDYIVAEGHVSKSDYTNTMRNQAYSSIYANIIDKPINLVVMCLDDAEFFNRFGDGFPFYQEHKTVVNLYAFVFFDGPHDSASILKEIEFFNNRSPLGAVWVFDDLDFYDHAGRIEPVLFNYGWSIVAKTTKKASYRKTRFSE